MPDLEPILDEISQSLLWNTQIAWSHPSLDGLIVSAQLEGYAVRAGKIVVVNLGSESITASTRSRGAAA